MRKPYPKSNAYYRWFISAHTRTSSGSNPHKPEMSAKEVGSEFNASELTVPVLGSNSPDFSATEALSNADEASRPAPGQVTPPSAPDERTSRGTERVSSSFCCPSEIVFEARGSVNADSCFFSAKRADLLCPIIAAAADDCWIISALFFGMCETTCVSWTVVCNHKGDQ